MTDAAISVAGASPRAGAGAGRWFFVWMAFIALAICFAGFLPTYLIPVSSGTFTRPPLVHLHGLTMFAWLALFTSQSWLAATGRTISHRTIGMLGLALATIGLMLLITTVVVDANESMRLFPGAGPAVRARGGDNVVRGVAFVCLVAAGVMSVRNTEIHKRLMLVANIVVVAPALGRIARVYFLGNPHIPPMPADVRLPMAIFVLVTSEVLIAALLWHDWRSRGRAHPVSLLGAALVVALNLAGSVGGTGPWQSLMQWLQRIGG